MRRKIPWLIYLILGLAVIGLFSQLFMNTTNFLKSIIYMIGFAALLFGLIYFIFLRNRSNSDEMAKYKQAVKQSRRKYKHNNNVRHTYKAHKGIKPSVAAKRKKINRRATHLRVIEGNKSKRKNRATY